MKQFIRHRLIPFIANKFDTKTLINHSKQSLIHVFYHTVSDKYLPHIHPLYSPKTVTEFEQDIDYLLKYFNPVGIEEVWRMSMEKKMLQKPSFHISFDDGLKEVYTTIAPILSRKGIPATVFVNSAFVDNKDLSYRHKAALIIDYLIRNRLLSETYCQISSLIPDDKKESLSRRILKLNYQQQSVLDDIATILGINFSSYLKEEKPYMTTDELKSLQSDGVTIGGHSIDHPNYMMLDEKEQIRQTIDSCNYVQQHFEEKYRFFAFPFMSEGVGASFFQKIYSSVDLTFGISGIKTEYEGRHIHRIDMENGAKIDPKSLINNVYLTQIIKSRF